MAKENPGGLFRNFLSCTWYYAFHYGLAPPVTLLQLISRMMEAQFLSIIDTCIDVMFTFTGMESLHARPSDRIQALATGDHFFVSILMSRPQFTFLASTHLSSPQLTKLMRLRFQA